MKSKLTTLCYLEKNDSYLLLHRIKKQNDINKDKWIGVGGHFEDFESPEECLLREVKEETGLQLRPENGRIVIQYSGQDHHTDVWLFEQDFEFTDVVLQEGETCDKRLSTPEEILEGLSDGTIVPFQYAKKWMEGLL